MKKLLTLFTLLAMFSFAGCESLGDGDVVGGSYSINGAIQKGPFVQGSNITIQPLNNKLKPIGQMYTTQTTNDAGMFEMDDVNSKYAEIIATGYYFDEVEGKISSGMLTLRSIADLKDGAQTNVNLLTTLTYNRIKNLVTKEGKKIAEAQSQAEKELYTTLGIPEELQPNVSCGAMSISNDGEGDGLLLAISVVLQHGRSVGELSEFLAQLSTDLADDGNISTQLLNKLTVINNNGSIDGVSSYSQLAESVRGNLSNRYYELGITISLPTITSYLALFDDVDNNGIWDGKEFAILEYNHIDLPLSATEFVLPLLSDINKCDISVEKDIDWVSLSINDNTCTVSVSANYTNSGRSATIILKDKKSDDALLFSIFQSCSQSIITYTYNPSQSNGKITIIASEESVGQVASNGNGAIFFDNSPSIIYSVSGKITTISFPESVVTIKNNAFQDCTSIQSVNLGIKTTTIEDSAFCDCSELENINIPESVTTIGDRAFYGCSKLKNITIHERITSVGANAFYGCIGTLTINSKIIETDFDSYSSPFIHLTFSSIVFGENITKIGDMALYDCPNLTSITIPNRVTSLGKGFLALTGLTNITIPESVSHIGESAFSNCQNLERFDSTFASDDGRCLIVDGVLTSFAPAGLTEYTIPDGITAIGEGVFTENTLSRIDIPNGVTSIGAYAFYCCNNLTRIDIPASVTQIGEGAFIEYNGLMREIHISDLTAWININFYSTPFYAHNLYLNGELVTEVIIPEGITTIKGLVFSYCTNITKISCPDSVTTIGGGAFDGCSSLASITIPDSVTEIGGGAFNGCSSLVSITIPGGVTEIGWGAFMYCTSLESVTISEGVTSIGDLVFDGCTSLTSITIPDSVTSIGEYAFYGCSSLAEVYCKPTTPPIGGNFMFYDNASGRKIYVPTESVDAYKTANYWSDYKSYIYGYDF